MSKRSSEPESHSNNKNKKRTVPFSSTEYLKDKIFIGDNSA